MELLGFYVCFADLEDELIRSLGAAAVEQVVDSQGDLESFRTFQKQPAWQGRTNEGQLRRFFGTYLTQVMEEVLESFLDDRSPAARSAEGTI